MNTHFFCFSFAATSETLDTRGHMWVNVTDIISKRHVSFDVVRYSSMLHASLWLDAAATRSLRASMSTIASRQSRDACVRFEINKPCCTIEHQRFYVHFNVLCAFGMRVFVCKLFCGSGAFGKAGNTPRVYMQRLNKTTSMYSSTSIIQTFVSKHIAQCCVLSGSACKRCSYAMGSYIRFVKLFCPVLLQSMICHKLVLVGRRTAYLAAIHNSTAVGTSSQKIVRADVRGKCR